MKGSRSDNPVAAMAAAQRLRLEAATADVVSAFEAAEVQSILLKGASIDRWLYTDGSRRMYSDCDLLVSPDARNRAQEVLVDLGFEPHIDERAMPEWWTEHGMGWLRRADYAAVDLHHTLAGVGASDEQLWATLASHVETIVLAGKPVRTLTVPGRAFHMALHVAQHSEWGIKQEELQRAIAVAGEQDWRMAAEIAEALDALGAFAVGLRMVPEGRALAVRLGLPADAPVDVKLRSGGSPPVALGFHQLAGARGLAARLRIVRHKALPPPTFMRAWSPLARRGRLGLLAAYAWRPLWILRHAPQGFRAWRAARRPTRH